MKNAFALVLALLVFGLVAAGCGDDDDSGDGGGGAAETAAETQTSDDTSPPRNEVLVSMQDIQFDPKSATVAKGGEITWTNNDSVGHDVTAEDDGFKSGAAGGLGKGDKFTERFMKAGSFKYVCTVHPGMEGTVTVK